MQHLIVSISILAFGMGIASCMYVYRVHSRYALFFLKVYLRYLIVLNISVFLNLSVHYVLTNVISTVASYHRVLIVVVVNIAGFFLFSLQTYFYLILTRSLIGKYIEKFVKHVMIGVIVAGSLAYGFSLAIYSSSSRITPFLAVHTTFTSILSIISLVASFSLFRGAKKAKTDSQRRTIRIFGLVYMVFFAWQLCLWLFPLQTLLLFSAINLLVLNVIPIPFLANLLKHHDKKFSLSAVAEDRVKAFYRKHGLSQRESEIADLILAGKSNEEIKDELFISVFTVKKHVSNIFMKLDINSRSQLNHMVMRAALPDSDKEEDSI